MANLTLEYGKRADAQHIPYGSDEWDLYVLFNVEHETIRQHLVQQARLYWRNQGLDGALQAAPTLLGDVSARYAPPEEVASERIYREAREGKLKAQDPGVKAARTMRIAFVVAFLVEATVMVVQQAISSDFNPFVLVLAVFLGLGGWMQGFGIGGLLTLRWKEQTGRAHAGEQARPAWIFLVVGSLAILLIAGIRAAGGANVQQRLIVFFITLLFGEAVAVCEALATYYRDQRKVLLAEVHQAQHWIANSEHDRLLRDSCGTYRRIYEDEVRQAERAGAQLRPLERSAEDAAPQVERG